MPTEYKPSEYKQSLEYKLQKYAFNNELIMVATSICRVLLLPKRLWRQVRSPVGIIFEDFRLGW